MSLSSQEQQVMDEAYAALSKTDGEEHAQRESVLGLVRTQVDDQTYAAIEECLENDAEAGRTRSFAIVDQPHGAAQLSDYAFGVYHVDQYENGGMSGDSFAGSVCIPVGAGKYLEYH